MIKPNKDNHQRAEVIALDPNPKGKIKPLTGADHDDWSHRLVNLLRGALPQPATNAAADGDGFGAVCAGMLDIKPADPVEGMLIAQAIAAHEAAMKMYRLGWLNNGKYFEAGTRYLALADKAARTLAMLIERLDQHRGRGQQQITVKHVTVSADQAVVTDQVINGRSREGSVARLLPASTEKPMEIIEPMQKPSVSRKGGGSRK